MSKTTQWTLVQSSRRRPYAVAAEDTDKGVVGPSTLLEW